MDDANSATQSLLSSEPLKSYKPSQGVVWQSYTLYAILAAACAIPWYTFITGVDYFDYRYPNSHIIRVLSISYLVAWLLFFVLFCKFGRQYTSLTRISWGLSLAGIAILVIPMVDTGFIGGQHGTNATYYVTIGAVTTAGAADAVAQGSLIGLTSELPQRYRQAIVIGTGSSGVLVFVLRLCARVVILKTLDSLSCSAVIYFTIASLRILAFLGAFIYVHKMPVMSYYNSLGLGSYDTVRMLLEDESGVTTEMSSAAAIATVAAGKTATTLELSYHPVLKKISLQVVAMALLSIVTLTIFPGFITEDVQSQTLGGLYPLLLTGTFVILDLLGRSLTVFTTTPPTPSSLLGGASARLVLLPFFMLVLVGPEIFRVEIAVFILTALLGLSHGYFFACMTIMIPTSFVSAESEAAGIIMTFISTTGCIIGACLGWIWTSVPALAH